MFIIEATFDSFDNSFKLEISPEVSFKSEFNNFIKVDTCFMSIILGNKNILIIVLYY